MSREITYAEAILEATDCCMEQDARVYVMGLGVPDPKGIFGTTQGLVEKYGPNRVRDMPTSENAMTGVAIGSALVGMRPIMTHQRVDFFLLALDQLINNAAKWRYMFGDQLTVPLVIRLIIGRGWGQGPQHSQTLHSLFSHIPGLKVVMPATPADAKGLLISAVQDPDPVVYLEHRWLHGIYGPVKEGSASVPIGKGRLVQEGTDLTVVACSQLVLEAYKACQMVGDDVSVDLIDLRSVKPLDTDLIEKSVRKTGRLLVLDPDWKFCGYGAELLAFASETLFDHLKQAPQRVTYPDSYSPTSWRQANHYYPTPESIALKFLSMLDKKVKTRSLLEGIIAQKMQKPQDTPDPSFKGPF